MNIFKRTASFIIAAIMLLVCFSGCAILTGDTAMAYGDYEITEVMYKYWMSKYKTIFLQEQNNAVDTVSFWTTEVETGYTNEDFLRSYVNDYAKQVVVSMHLFDEYGLSFSEAQKNDIEKRLSDLTEAYGGKNVLNEVLGEMGLNIETLEHIYYEEAKLDTVNEYFFGSNGIFPISDNDREAYYKDNFYCAQWIYIYTDYKLKTDEEGRYFTDANGIYQYEKLTDVEKQEKQKIVEELEKELAEGKDFIELRTKYSEEGLEYYVLYPDGIFFSANHIGQYDVDMISTVQGLKDGEYTKFNNGYATVFVKRIPLKNYAMLTENERKLLNVPSKREVVSFDRYVLLSKAQTFFDGYEVSYFDDVMNRYDLKTLKGSKNTSI